MNACAFSTNVVFPDTAFKISISGCQWRNSSINATHQGLSIRLDVAAIAATSI